MLAFLASIPHKQTLILTALTIILLEGVLYFYRKYIKDSYKSKKSEILSFEEAERESLLYFSKLHIISVIRIVYFFLLVMTLVAVYDVRAFSFFAFVFGAVIIALRKVIISVIAYPYVIVNYDIGDDVRIVDVLGEIVRVRPLSTQLAGKDENGDYNGKLQIIPNSKFLLKIIEKQEIKNGAYRMVTLQVFYKREAYRKPFLAWLPDLKEQLDSMLKKRSLKDVGNFKNYAGMRYKLRYDYNEDGDIVLNISFISSSKNLNDKKEQIISFVESTKKEQETTLA